MRVVVVGGGFAGLAAAIRLQEQRHDVLLLERRGVLGGRATSYRDAASGEDVDNGTHLMIAGYGATLDLVRHAGAADLLDVQDDLRIDYVDDQGPTALACPRLPAPLHLLAGLFGLRVPWRVRLDALRLGLAIRLGGKPSGLSLADYFRRHGQSAITRRLLWDPLAIAILNETPERADASLFWNVYREAFLRTNRASRLVFLRRGWGELHERLAAYFEARGGTIRRRALAESIEVRDGRAAGVRYVQRAETRDDIRKGRRAEAVHAAAEAVVAAVPWHALPGLLPEPWPHQAPFAGLRALGSSPIVSIELWLDRVAVDKAMVGLRDSEVEWVFDKGRLFGRAGPPQHLAFIVSAAVRSSVRPNAELALLAETALRRYFPAMAGAAVTRSLVMREAEATFSCGPEAEAARFGPDTPLPGLYVAGDWTNTGLPATIEGAVRSGLAAADELARAVKTRPSS
ncbi:MAG TPA: hydroxysqualene dehydroxylase HpnE [Vicinamibacteria bacterium]|nr:hydroxysqualene dehydroxylase HpnE [Vicinamibacteria bacterium]